MRLINSLGRWQVTLTIGVVVEVWADSYTEEDGKYLFGVLAGVDPAEQEGLLMHAETPSDPRRVVATLAVVPSEQVAKVRSA